MIKNILRLSLVTLVFIMSGCDATDLDLLDDPNAVTPDKAEVDLFYNNIQVYLSLMMAGNSDDEPNNSGDTEFAALSRSINESCMEVVRMEAMTGGNMYDNSTEPQSFDYVWNMAYADILPDIDIMLPLAEEVGFTYHTGSAKIMKAYILMVLVDMFGDVPYSEAGQGFDNLNPKADNGADIYAAAFDLLESGIEDMRKDATALPANDLFYNSNGEGWIKAANSLKLRYYMTTRLSDPSTASAGVASLIADGELISSAADDFQFNYGSSRAAPDSRHPWYRESYEAGPTEYLSNNYMWLLMGRGDAKEVPDPRLNYYFYRQDLDTTDEDQFTLDCAGVTPPLHYIGDYPWCVAGTDGYWGRDHGNNDGIPPDDTKRTVFGLYPAAGKYDAGTGGSVQNGGTDGAGGNGIFPIMLSSYVDFLLAEAALTLGTGGDAAALLESGVRKSIDKVMNFRPGAVDAATAPTTDDVEAYVAEVMSLYTTAGSDDERLNVIIREYHIALWGNGVEAYNNYRRTGMPWGLQPTREADSGNFPRSMLYPSDYVNLNSNANQKTITQQVFWDTNPAGFIQ